MRNLLLLLLSVLFLIYSCGDKSKKEETGPSEPNNEIENANLINKGEEFKMKIHPKEDVDWYRVVVPGKGYLKLVSKNVPENLDLQARFATYEEWEEEKINFLSDFLKFPATVQLENIDTCYAIIADRWNENANEKEFSVKFEFIEEFDEHESNNDMKNAKEINPNKEYKSAIFPKGDKDWFKFITNEPGYVHIAYKDKPENLKLSATLSISDEFGGDEMKVIKNTEELPTSIALNEPEEYFLKLSDRWNEEASEDIFNWKIDFIEEMDTLEPNNEYDDAKSVKFGDTVKIAIFPKEDIDIFKISPKEKGVLKIKSSKMKELNLSAGIYKLNTDENKLKEVKSVNELPYEFDIEETNLDYYIKVYDRWKENESQKLFDLVFELDK